MASVLGPAELAVEWAEEFFIRAGSFLIKPRKEPSSSLCLQAFVKGCVPGGFKPIGWSLRKRFSLKREFSLG